MKSYEFIDSGEGKKLERFGSKLLVRPCSQALWKPSLSQKVWEQAEDEFTRTTKGQWKKQNLLGHWLVQLGPILLKLEKTSFGHVGLFPEHQMLWPWIQKQMEKKTEPSILNLFAYSGAATLFAAKQGANVCHVDASPGMVQRARENAEINQLEKAPIRWIVEDVLKFLKREIRRGRKYDGVILDPPSFGRGSKGEVFKIEEHLMPLLSLVKDLLSDTPLFVAFTCHTPGITPLTLENVLGQMFTNAQIEVGELSLKSKHQKLPGGIYGCVSFS